MYPGFEADGKYDATAAAFSPDGKVLYLATTANVLLALDSDGSTTSHVIKYTGGSDLCDIAVSPDGLSVSWVLHLSRKTFHVVQFQKNCREIGSSLDPLRFRVGVQCFGRPELVAKSCAVPDLSSKPRHLSRDYYPPSCSSGNGFSEEVHLASLSWS